MHLVNFYEQNWDDHLQNKKMVFFRVLKLYRREKTEHKHIHYARRASGTFTQRVFSEGSQISFQSETIRLHS